MTTLPKHSHGSTEILKNAVLFMPVHISILLQSQRVVNTHNTITHFCSLHIYYNCIIFKTCFQKFAFLGPKTLLSKKWYCEKNYVVMLEGIFWY